MCITLEESSDFSQIYYIATDICKKRTLTSKREGERERERERERELDLATPLRVQNPVKHLRYSFSKKLKGTLMQI